MPSDQVSRYLLGGLPEGEMQRLGTLLETDAQFQQRVKIVEDDLIDCFVKGQLKGEDLMRFRRYFLASPTHRERVKVAQGYLDDWAVVQETEPTPAQKAARRVQEWLWPESLQSALNRLWMTLGEPVKLGLNAAMLLGLAICAFLVFDAFRLQYKKFQDEQALTEAQQHTEALTQEVNQQQRAAESADEKIKRLREQLAQPSGLQNAIANAANNALAALPGTAQAATPAVAVTSKPAASVTPGGLPVVPVMPGADDILFHLDLTRDTSASYRAELRALNANQKLWESGTLKAREKDTGRIVEVKIPTSLLAPRAYTLKVIGLNGAVTTPYALHYSFRVNEP
jgi:hypothetical protein